MREVFDLGIALDPVRWNGGHHAVNQGSKACFERAKDGGLLHIRGHFTPVAGAQFEGGDEAAMLAFHGDIRPHDGADAEGFDVAAEDSAEEGGSDFGEDLGAEVAEDEGGDALVWIFGGVGGQGAELVGAEDFVVEGLFGFGGEEGGGVEGFEVSGDHHAHAVGDGLESAVEEDPGFAGGVEGGDDFGLEAEFDGEVAGPGLLGDPAVGAALDDEAALADGFDDAAETGGGFEEGDGQGGVELGELPGGGDAGDASADDGDAFWGGVQGISLDGCLVG